jgi:ABC-type Mn2+/Zn2+ transport system permease subunit
VTALIEILSPEFLLRQALIGSILVGLVCPLVGVYFILRRMIFLGVALPQVSAAGIAFAALVHQIVTTLYGQIVLSERWLATIGSMTFTLAGLLILAAFERHRDTMEARIGVAYAVGAAATMLFLAANPTAEAHMVNLLKGDILATTGLSLTLMVWIFGVVVLVLMAFRKEFLLVSFDRDLAVVFGKRVELWNMLIYLTIGIAISLGVITAGPIVTFGFLVVPPFTARLITHRMLTFSLTSAGLGAVTAFVGFYCAYRFDLPLGPTEVVLASLVLVLIWAINRVCHLIGGWWAT